MSSATSNSATANQDKKLKGLIADLQSGSDDRVLGAAKELRVYGNDKAVAPLIDAMVSTKSDKVYQALRKMLFELKAPNASQAIATSLRSSNTQGHRNVLVSAYWEAGLESAPHLDLFVDLALEEDFETCLECLTVIENMGTGFDEAQVFPHIKRVKEAIGNDDRKDMLYKSLVEVLQDLVIG